MTEIYMCGCDNGLNMDWVRNQALELCNLMAIRLVEVKEEKLYENKNRVPMFAKVSVTEKRYKTTKYSIVLEGESVDVKTAKLVIDAWRQGANSRSSS